MSSKQDLENEIVETINAHYKSLGVKKTISADNWSRIIEECSVETANKVAATICAKHGVPPPSDATEVDSLDAAAQHIFKFEALSNGKRAP